MAPAITVHPNAQGKGTQSHGNYGEKTPLHSTLALGMGLMHSSKIYNFARGVTR